MNMHPTVRAARISGACYLPLTVTSLFSYIYGNSVVVSGNAAATAHNILSAETLYRVSIVFVLFAAVVFILPVRALYRLLSRINRNQSWLMVAFVLVSIPISFVGALFQFAATTFMRGGGYLSVFNQAQLEAICMAFLNLSVQLANLNSIFFGFWLLPLGALVYASGFIPPDIRRPAHHQLLRLSGHQPRRHAQRSRALLDGLQRLILLPQAAGEVSFMAWLLIKGANVQALQPTLA